MAQGVSGTQSLLHIIHDVTCLSVCCLFVFVSFPVSLSLLPFLFHSLPVLCPAQLPQCCHLRRLKTLPLMHNEGVLPRGDIQSSHTCESVPRCQEIDCGTASGGRKHKRQITASSSSETKFAKRWPGCFFLKGFR